ncbi:MAG: bifunctional hydroxymethylpyrimidine kinase/phosphomethylpyrimidine kinase [Alphaproteobacteria bacterium]|nr:bifunctional hydroxymethylpyrimidine kinase/phosphomethylpyrimidine kinase [Alphaproteobacteria bacterium]
MRGRILIVAGSDSGGGAGIQADIKTVTALDGYAMTAITALTAQDTRGVHGVVPVDPAFIRQQMELCLADIGADAIKTGMLHDGAVIAAVAGTVEARAPKAAFVVDPVMVAKGGAKLLRDDAIDAVRKLLAPLATVMTPNTEEAAALTGIAVASTADMERAGRAILALGCGAVLMKGGHLSGPVVHDLLVEASGIARFESPRVETRSTHGTGCTLASAIATGLAQGLGLADAVRRARAYVLQAILSAPGLGHGHGPLNHAHTVRRFTA